MVDSYFKVKRRSELLGELNLNTCLFSPLRVIQSLLFLHYHVPFVNCLENPIFIVHTCFVNLIISSVHTTYTCYQKTVCNTEWSTALVRNDKHANYCCKSLFPFFFSPQTWNQQDFFPIELCFGIRSVSWHCDLSWTTRILVTGGEVCQWSTSEYGFNKNTTF